MKPIAVRMVYQVAQAVYSPIIGMGGIATAEDALEFIMAGATAVSVGTANFFNPYATVEIADGMAKFMEAQQVEDIHRAHRSSKIKSIRSIVISKCKITEWQERAQCFSCCLYGRGVKVGKKRTNDMTTGIRSD